jgi:hypothetical protein
LRWRVGTPFGLLERLKKPTADLASIIERLETGREGLPFVVTEIAVPGPRCDHEEVVRNLTVIPQPYALATCIHAFGLSQQDRHVPLPTQHPTNRDGDVARNKRGGRHLIRQGLEQVVIRPIDQCDSYRRATKLPRGMQPPKPPPRITTRAGEVRLIVHVYWFIVPIERLGSSLSVLSVSSSPYFTQVHSH